MSIKRTLKSIAKAGWAGMGPVRRPLVRKFHLMMNDHQRSVLAEIDRRLTPTLAEIDRRLTPTLAEIDRRLTPALASLQELELMLDSMVRELTRLQAQVEMLQQKLDEQSAEMSVARLGTIDEADDGDPYAAGSGQRPLALGFDTHWNRKSG